MSHRMDRLVRLTPLIRAQIAARYAKIADSIAPPAPPSAIPSPTRPLRTRLHKSIKPLLFEKQQGCCAYCHHPLPTTYHVDHVIPLALGGPNHPTNYVLACPPCNLSKRAMPPILFLKKISWRSSSLPIQS